MERRGDRLPSNIAGVDTGTHTTVHPGVAIAAQTCLAGDRAAGTVAQCIEDVVYDADEDEVSFEEDVDYFNYEAPRRHLHHSSRATPSRSDVGTTNISHPALGATCIRHYSTADVISLLNLAIDIRPWSRRGWTQLAIHFAATAQAEDRCSRTVVSLQEKTRRIALSQESARYSPAHLALQIRNLWQTGAIAFLPRRAFLLNTDTSRRTGGR